MGLYSLGPCGPLSAVFIALRARSIVSALRASVNDLDLDLDKNTPWVNMSPYAKFCLDRPSRLAGHRQQTNRQINRRTSIAFYYVDLSFGNKYCVYSELLI